MFRERGDGGQAPAHVEGGNQRGGQEARQEKEQSNPSEAVEHSIGPKRGNGDGEDKRFGFLREWYQRETHGLSGTQGRKTEGWLCDGSADPFQGYGTF